MRYIRQIKIIENIYNFFFSYPVAVNLNYIWNFGVYSFFFLIIQIITGVFLAMHYVPEFNLAFLSIEHIMRDVQYGWLLRYIHANGASMFFIVVYIHFFRGFYYNSYSFPREKVWISGIIILLMMIVTAFLGYVLPWGQMSFWAATVITNLVSAVPKIGFEIVIWLWGGYAVDSATLNRFFSLHYFFPFIIIALVFIHFIFLHENGSNNPIGIEFKHFDHLTMYPYYIIKDLFGLIIFFIVFFIIIFFMPNILGHTDNYIYANPLVTPIHIVPEWYFLPFYAILRSIPDKLFGVIIMLSSILIFLFLPFYIKPKLSSMNFRPISRIFFFFFILNCILLGWIGSCPANFPYVEFGQVFTSFYFIYILIILPSIILFENLLVKRNG